MKLIFWLIGFFATIVAIMIYLNSGEKIYWNQKYTLIVETPEGEVQNETTTSVNTFTTGLKWYSFRKLSWSIGQYGESPHVQLPNGKYLFALSLYETFLVQRAFAASTNLDSKTAANHKIWKSIPGSAARANLVPDFLPMFITFDNIDDPETVRQVDPMNLEDAFGPGYNLKSFSVQETDEPATYGSIRSIREWMMFKNDAFNPSYVGINERGSSIKEFNRSVLARTINCAVDRYSMNNLTFGWYKKGVFCSY